MQRCVVLISLVLCTCVAGIAAEATDGDEPAKAGNFRATLAWFLGQDADPSETAKVDVLVELGTDKRVLKWMERQSRDSAPYSYVYRVTEGVENVVMWLAKDDPDKCLRSEIVGLNNFISLDLLWYMYIHDICRARMQFIESTTWYNRHVDAWGIVGHHQMRWMFDERGPVGVEYRDDDGHVLRSLLVTSIVYDVVEPDDFFTLPAACMDSKAVPAHLLLPNYNLVQKCCAVDDYDDEDALIRSLAEPTAQLEADKSRWTFYQGFVQTKDRRIPNLRYGEINSEPESSYIVVNSEQRLGWEFSTTGGCDCSAWAAVIPDSVFNMLSMPSSFVNAGTCRVMGEEGDLYRSTYYFLDDDHKLHSQERTQCVSNGRLMLQSTPRESSGHTVCVTVDYDNDPVPSSTFAPPPGCSTEYCLCNMTCCDGGGGGGGGLASSSCSS